MVSLAGLHNKRMSGLIGTFSFAESVLLLKLKAGGGGTEAIACFLQITN